MTDLLDVDGSQITIRAPNGQIRFTTNEPMFHVTDTVNGQYNVTFPNNPATSAYNRIRSIQLASGLTSQATHVVGVLQTTGDSYGRYPSGTWFDAGGTYLHRMHWWSSNAQGTFGEAVVMNHAVSYTFRVSSGRLFLDEDVRFAPYETNGLQSLLPVSLSNFTLRYRLKIGLFT